MRFISDILAKVNKTPAEFISYICDDRRNHDLWKYKGNVMIKIDANDGSGKKIFIDERLNDVLDKFIKE